MREGYRRLLKQQRQERDERIMELLSQGLKQWQVAERLGLAKGGVATIVSKKEKGEN